MAQEETSWLAESTSTPQTQRTNREEGSAAHWIRRDFSRDSWGPELSSPGEEGPICTTLEGGAQVLQSKHIKKKTLDSWITDIPLSSLVILGAEAPFLSWLPALLTAVPGWKKLRTSALLSRSFFPWIHVLQSFLSPRPSLCYPPAPPIRL